MADSMTLKTNSRRRQSSVFARGSIRLYIKAVILFIGFYYDQELRSQKVTKAELFISPWCADAHDSSY